MLGEPPLVLGEPPLVLGELPHPLAAMTRAAAANDLLMLHGTIRTDAPAQSPSQITNEASWPHAAKRRHNHHPIPPLEQSRTVKQLPQRTPSRCCAMAANVRTPWGP